MRVLAASSPAGAVVAVGVLLAVLGFCVLRPRGLPEVVAAGPAAALVVLLGLVGGAKAWAEVESMAPTVAFLAAVLTLPTSSRRSITARP